MAKFMWSEVKTWVFLPTLYPGIGKANIYAVQKNSIDTPKEPPPPQYCQPLFKSLVFRAQWVENINGILKK